MAHDLYRQGLLELLAEIMKGSPQGTEKEHHDQLWKKVKNIESYYLTLFDNWFASNYPFMECVSQGPHDITVRRKKRAAPRHLNAYQSARNTQLKKDLANFILAQQILSTGEFMEDSTVGDVKRESSYFQGVARTVERKGGALAHVGKHLKEKDLKNIRLRYFKSDNNQPTPSKDTQAGTKTAPQARV